jgi:hypothetical protein
VPILKVQDLKPGMILLSEVQNYSGRKLLPEGTLLTEKHILNLKAWGVIEANVKLGGAGSDSTPKVEKIDSKKLAQAEKEVQALFCFSNQNHPAVIELMRLSSLNRLKKMPEMGHINVK